MAWENELTESIAKWLVDRYYDPEYNLLIHEEVSGRWGRRPDILVARAPIKASTRDDIEIILVEIECSSKAAIRERGHGLNQLKKYLGNYKFLAIPHTILRGKIIEQIYNKSQERGIGLLIVNMRTMVTECQFEPKPMESKSLLVYPVAWKRWKALRKSNDIYRRISGRVIIERR